jgi:hypothetical protein
MSSGKALIQNDVAAKPAAISSYARPPPTPPKYGGAVLKWVRDPRWGLGGDSDFSHESGSDLD